MFSVGQMTITITVRKRDFMELSAAQMLLVLTKHYFLGSIKKHINETKRWGELYVEKFFFGGRSISTVSEKPLK